MQLTCVFYQTIGNTIIRADKRSPSGSPRYHKFLRTSSPRSQPLRWHLLLHVSLWCYTNTIMVQMGIIINRPSLYEGADQVAMEIQTFIIPSTK